MNCESCSENLTAYSDGELPSGIAREVRAHLEGCPPCSMELRLLQASAQLADSHLEVIEPSSRIWHGIHRELAEGRPLGDPAIVNFIFARRWLAASALAAGLLVTGFGITMYWQRRAAASELQSYMAAYIEQRESKEATHRPAGMQQPDLKHREFADNPFVVSAVSVEYRNPFRREQP